MLYGYRAESVLVVVAADTREEFDAFKSSSAIGEEASSVDLLMEDHLRGLREGFVIDFADDASFETWTKEHAFQLIHKFKAGDRQRVMDPPPPSTDKRSIREIYGLDKHDPWDRRTEEEKDAATRDKEREKRLKEIAKQHGGITSDDSFSGATTHDSGTASVTDVNIRRDAEGNATGVDVIAVKGVYDDLRALRKWEAACETAKELGEPLPPKPQPSGKKSVNAPALFEVYYDAAHEGRIKEIIALLGQNEPAFRPAANGQGSFETDNQMLVDLLPFSLEKRGIPVSKITETVAATRDGELYSETTDFRPNPTRGALVSRGQFVMFYRVDVARSTLEEVLEILALKAINAKAAIIYRGEDENGVWLVCAVERVARKVKDAIDAESEGLLETDVYAIKRGEGRMAPKGVTVADPNAVLNIGPRPWNERAAEWEAMSEEAKAAEIKKMRGEEFIFTGNDVTQFESFVFFTPKSYFEKHEKMWEGGEMAPFLGKFVPQYLKPAENERKGMFKARGRQFENISFELCQRGIDDNPYLRMWMNLQ